jgi:hypothetical protein
MYASGGDHGTIIAICQLQLYTPDIIPKGRSTSIHINPIEIANMRRQSSSSSSSCAPS